MSAFAVAPSRSARRVKYLGTQLFGRRRHIGHVLLREYCYARPTTASTCLFTRRCNRHRRRRRVTGCSSSHGYDDDVIERDVIKTRLAR